MSFLDFFQKRYTTKSYQQGFKLSDSQLNTLQEILRLSPSSINSQPWHFVLVGDESLKNQLSEVSQHNKEKIQKCSHLIVFGVYRSAEVFEKERVNGMTIESYYREQLIPRGEEYVKNWMTHQAYIALGVLLSACASMGIDSTPMEGIERDRYDLLLGQDKFQTVFAVALGKRAPNDTNQLSITPKRRCPLEELWDTK